MNNNASAVEAKENSEVVTETTQPITKLTMTQITKTLIDVEKIREHKEDGSVDWTELSKVPDLSADFIKEFIDHISPAAIAVYHIPSNEVYDLLKDRFNYDDWKEISTNHHFLNDIELVTTYAGYVNWDAVSKEKKLNVELLRKFKLRLNWKRVSERRKFSNEEFVEFQDVIYWGNVKFTSENYKSKELEDILAKIRAGKKKKRK